MAEPTTRSVFEALRNITAFWPGDWSEDRRLAWLYGIIAGWDEEGAGADPGEEYDAMGSVAAKHDWDSVTVARLRMHRAEFKALSVAETRILELEHTGRAKDQRIRELEATVASLNRSVCAGLGQRTDGEFNG
jgi:hypothetical protein